MLLTVLVRILIFELYNFDLDIRDQVRTSYEISYWNANRNTRIHYHNRTARYRSE